MVLFCYCSVIDVVDIHTLSFWLAGGLPSWLLSVKIKNVYVSCFRLDLIFLCMIWYFFPNGLRHPASIRYNHISFEQSPNSTVDGITHTSPLPLIHHLSGHTEFKYYFRFYIIYKLYVLLNVKMWNYIKCINPNWDVILFVIYLIYLVFLGEISLGFYKYKPTHTHNI